MSQTAKIERFTRSQPRRSWRDHRLRERPTLSARDNSRRLAVSAVAHASVASPLFVGPFGEVLQIRRPLSLLGGHQLAIGCAHVDLALDLHIRITLGADCLDPDEWPQLAIVALVRHPGTDQRVDIDALLDDALGIEMKGRATGVVSARVLEVARLDLENVVFAVAVLVDPFADRVT